jgi:PIN domain nuclease of toxin-antitoxin system
MIVLDTHAWIWWINNSPELTPAARKHIQKAKTKKAIYISSISAWEVSMLVKTSRLHLVIPVDEWIMKCEQLPFIQFVPVSNAIACQSVYLPGEFHKDPADRIIVATARLLNMKVMTKDDKILSYPHVDAQWNK